MPCWTARPRSFARTNMDRRQGPRSRAVNGGDQEPLGDFDLIDRYFASRRPAAPAAPGAKRRTDVVLGIGDDAALLRCPPECDLVAAVDTLVEGRHFPAGSAPRSIGH